MATNDRLKALAKHLDADVSDMKVSSYDKCLVEYNGRGQSGGEYLVLTDKEADKRVAEYIKESVWAFNDKFVASHGKLSYEHMMSILPALQDKCESGNDAVVALIKNMKKFIDDAVRADGRGHFLNHYDGSEDEVKVGAKRYYIYRQN